VLGLGVRLEIGLARDAGLEIGELEASGSTKTSKPATRRYGQWAMP
jgi:hypothetical protein